MNKAQGRAGGAVPEASTDAVDVDVAIIGGGVAAEALARELRPHDCSVTVFEPGLVGGTCPFTACIPTKTMLHDASASVTWEEALDHREEVTNGLDDSDHAARLVEGGATLVRERARFVGENELVAGGRRFRAEHVVVATGSEPFVPDLPGLDELGDLVWTSDDAMLSRERPQRLAVVGGGAIGCELATVYAGFGSDVVLYDVVDQPFPSLRPRVGEIVQDGLASIGVDARYGVAVERFDRLKDGVRVLAGGDEQQVDRVLVAAGRRPSIRDLGLEVLGLDGNEPLPVEATGRIRGTQSVWAMGDVAGLDQYTHVANHHASVVADQLVGSGERRFDDVVVPACIFIQPPVIVVGPASRFQTDDTAESGDDDDLVWSEVEVGRLARSATDRLGAGVLAAAASRRTGCLAAVHGVGPRFDELVHAFTIAIDGEVPLRRLRQSLWAFPTVGDLIGPLISRLSQQLDDQTRAQ